MVPCESVMCVEDGLEGKRRLKIFMTKKFKLLKTYYKRNDKAKIFGKQSLQKYTYKTLSGVKYQFMMLSEYSSFFILN